MTEKEVWRIAVIPGDGIGTEVVREGRRLLDALAQDSGGRFAFEWESFPWGSEYYLENARMMAEDALQTLEGFDAIYFGAVGWPGVPDHVSLWGLRIAICQGFDQYANLRRLGTSVNKPASDIPLAAATRKTLDLRATRGITGGSRERVKAPGF
jgi:tartrate dehydrogenase/decarboxylase/D-malate dehydrogenase